MKKLLFVLVIGAAIPAITNAQHQVRLNLYGNYVFNDHVDNYYSANSYFNGTIEGGFLWGGGIEFELQPNYSLELLYERLDTHTPLEYYDNSVKNTSFKTAINYIMLGGSHSFHTSDSKFEPFGGFMLGAAIIDATNPTTNVKHSGTRFAWGLRLGGNIWASDKVGIKLQTQLMSAVQGAGGGIYFGTGGGGVGVSTYSTMLQFSLGGGLVFKLGK